MKNVSAFLGWLFGLVFTFTGVVQFALGYFFAGLFLILAGLICFPSIRKKISLKFRIEFSSDACLAAVVCLCLVSTGQFAMNREQEREQEEAKKLGFASVEEYRADKELKEKNKALKEANEAIAKNMACRKDLSCWGNKHSISAEGPCKRSIERLANYSFQWTDGMLGYKFTKFAWADKKKGILTFYGDSIQFQNGFGAFQNFIYSCDYDTLNERVVDASAEPGRF